MTDGDESRLTRRSIGRKVAIGGLTLTGSIPFSAAVTAQTGSGYVELDYLATVPADTTLEITIREETDDGVNMETQTIPDGDATIAYQQLRGYAGQGYTYELTAALESADGVDTPELDEATVIFPEEEPPEPQLDPVDDPVVTNPDTDGPLLGLWRNCAAFVTFIILVFVGIPTGKGSLATGALAGVSIFAYLALFTGIPLMRNLLYLVVVMMALGVAFKLWRLEGGGEV